MNIEAGTLCRVARCPDAPRMVGLMCVTRSEPEYRPMQLPSGIVVPVLGVEVSAPWLPIGQGRRWAIEVALLEPVVGTIARAHVYAELGAVPMLPRPTPPHRTGWPFQS